MPLSEHEQKILAQLEDSLSKQDPRFAKNVREANVYTHAGRRVRWGVAGFLVGTVVLVLGFVSSIAMGLVGVAIMFGSALLVERNVRRLGKASWRDLTKASGSDDSPSTLGPRTQSIRDWLAQFKREAR
jgi:hypothetical protein